jgi:hypothetical protein
MLDFDLAGNTTYNIWNFGQFMSILEGYHATLSHFPASWLEELRGESGAPISFIASKH